MMLIFKGGKIKQIFLEETEQIARSQCCILGEKKASWMAGFEGEGKD